MAIIDPEGLFSGERLASCSDLAQLYWPRFFLAANSCGRIELSYKSLISRVFGNFQNPPKSDELWRIFREYDENFLAILYQSESGTWWCQFITSEKYLPKYKKTRDSMSPAPPFELVELHNRGYIDWKKSKSFQNQSFQKFSDNAESFGREGIGVGIGVGVGEGIGEIQNPSRKRKRKERVPDPRHSQFRESLEKYWEKKNPTNPDLPWGPADAKQLSLMLEANPAMDVEGFRNLLRNRAKSDVVHGDPVRRWIGNVTQFTVPLDRYGKPMTNENGGKNAAVSNTRGLSSVGVLKDFINDTERGGDADENGDLPPSDFRQGDAKTIRGVSGTLRLASVSGGDAEHLDF